ncbi:MAG TPA: hemerythrin domain-containing protein, partial [Elusimicrobiota bacterium]|nr:hemerythrin domain-containing protein [Elusimicrobiota bacterium]
AELEKMQAHDEQYNAKFMVLAESVRHHIKEEEGEMFPEARDADLDLEELGRKMMERKDDLQSRGVPASKEEEILEKVGSSE